MVEFDPEDALRILEFGESLGIRSGPSLKETQPFFNPHLLVKTPERLEFQKQFFRRLLENCRVLLFNSGVGKADDIISKIKESS